MPNDDSNAMSRYMADLASCQPLTTDQEQRLSERILAGDHRATQQLATANLRLVVATASQYTNHGVDIEDLISEGNIALLKAASKYDASRGRFASYASPIIRHHMQRAIDIATGKTTMPATADEPATRRANRKLSMDAPLGGRENVSLLSMLPNPDAPTADTLLANKMDMASLTQALGYLGDRERIVVTQYFGIGCERMTMAEIAAGMGAKRERVRQIRDKATRKLRKALRNDTNTQA